MHIIVILAIILGSLILLLGISCCIFGFRQVGVAAGSCAACCQSIIGNVVKGSWFAIMTCLGMRGCFIALIIIGLLVLSVIGIYFLVNSEWFQSVIQWFKDIPKLFNSITATINSTDAFQYFYTWPNNISFTNNTKQANGFLQW